MEILEKNEYHYSGKIKCANYKKDGLGWDNNKPHCGSILSFDENDIQCRKWEKFLYQQSGIDYTIICPGCGCIIDVSAVIPAEVKFLVRNREMI